jgi:hypothetical protein
VAAEAMVEEIADSSEIRLETAGSVFTLASEDSFWQAELSKISPNAIKQAAVRERLPNNIFLDECRAAL